MKVYLVNSDTNKLTLVDNVPVMKGSYTFVTQQLGTFIIVPEK